jgi:hypothetical protein
MTPLSQSEQFKAALLGSWEVSKPNISSEPAENPMVLNWLSPEKPKQTPAAALYSDFLTQLEKLSLEATHTETEKSNMSPKSQKIIGLKALESISYVLTIARVQISPVRYILQRADIENQIFDFPLFARGCPLRPRHGFVDSITVKNKPELLALWDKVREADPEGEMLVGPFVASTHNMVWMPTGMAIGPLHDGATAGRDSIFVPLVKGEWTEKSTYKALIDKAKIAAGEVPYIEAVAIKYTTSLDASRLIEATQCRSGPLVDSLSSDYIPEETVVQEVVQAEGDLIEWEAKAEKFRPGTVVYHPGGTLASHYSVHGVNHKIPVCISFQPKVGDILKPTKSIKDLDIDALQRGIVAGHVLPLKARNDWVKAVSFLLVALHNANAQRGEHSWMLGAASSVMCRIGLGLACGEMRHYSGTTPMGPYVKNLPRDQVYANAFNDYFVYRLLFTHTIHSYINKKWVSSYGGKAWAACAAAAAKLDTAIGHVMRDGTEESAKKLVDVLNTAVNQAHNGGWWLNKIIHQDVMNQAAEGSPGPALLAAPAYYEIKKLINEQVGSQTVAPLLRFLPPIQDEVKPRTVKVQVKKTVVLKEDVPQIYSLEYPKPTPPEPEVEAPTFERLQIRAVADGSHKVMRAQVGYTHQGKKSHFENDKTIDTVSWQILADAVANATDPYQSYHGTGAKYIGHPATYEWDGLNFTVRFTFNGKPYTISFVLITGKKVVAKPIEWWKPGVVIPVKWKKKTGVEIKEIEVPEWQKDSYSYDIETPTEVSSCHSCGEETESVYNKYCNSCWDDLDMCDSCSEKSKEYTDGEECPNCGHTPS